MEDIKKLAKQDYLNGLKQKDICQKYDVPLNTLKSWIQRGKWAQEKNAPKKNKGAPVGNQNAKGFGAPRGNKNALNNDGGAPRNNKNALRTGEHETIMWDFLSDDERSLFGSMDDDPLIQIQSEILTLQIRQRRMMKRISEAEKGLNDKESSQLMELRGRKKIIENVKGRKVTVEIPDLVITEMREKTTRKIDDVLRIEEALTRISNQLVRAMRHRDDIEQLEYKKQLLQAQIEFTRSQSLKLALDNNEVLEDEEIEDDGFMDAIEGLVNDKEVWPDADET